MTEILVKGIPIAQYKREWRKRRKEENNAYLRAWHAANPGKRAVYRDRLLAKHPDYFVKWMAKHKQRNKMLDGESVSQK